MPKPRRHIVHDRQIRLANVRTFLAFIRTSIACFGLGIALFHLMTIQFYRTLGLVFIILGGIIFSWGVGEYYFVQKHYIQDIADHDNT